MTSDEIPNFKNWVSSVLNSLKTSFFISENDAELIALHLISNVYNRGVKLIQCCVYISGFYTGQNQLKTNLSRQGCTSVVPKLLLNGLRKLWDVARNAALLQKKVLHLSHLDPSCQPRLLQVVGHYFTAIFT